MILAVLWVFPSVMAPGVTATAATSSATATSPICNSLKTDSSAIHTTADNPDGTLAAGGSLTVAYEIEATGYDFADGPLAVYIPSLTAFFPTGTSGTTQVFHLKAELNLTAAGWNNPNATHTTVTKSLTSSVTFRNPNTAYISSEQLALQAGPAYNGELTLEFRWQWVEDSGGVVTYSPWSVPSTSATSPNLPTIFYPAPHVGVVSTTPSPVAEGTNYSAVLDGAIHSTSFLMVVEYPNNGTEIRSIDEATGSALTTFDAYLPLSRPGTDLLAPGAYLVHIHDVCNALLYSISVQVVAPSSPSDIQHVIVVYLENEAASSVLKDGPFEKHLAYTYAYASNYYAITHPSAPNYLAGTSGSVFSQTGSDNYHVYSSVNLGDLVQDAGKTWAAYDENMPTPCDLNNTTSYAVKHNPFTFYQDIIDDRATECNVHDLPQADWNTSVADNTVPNYVFYTPNLYDDGHNSNVEFADAWLKAWLSPLLNDSFFQSSVFLITYDEGANDAGYNGTAGGNVYFVAVSPYARMHSTLAENESHYDMLTTVEWLLGLGTTGQLNDNVTLWPAMTSLFSFTSSSAAGATSLTEPGTQVVGSLPAVDRPSFSPALFPAMAGAVATGSGMAKARPVRVASRRGSSTVCEPATGISGFGEPATRSPS